MSDPKDAEIARLKQRIRELEIALGGYLEYATLPATTDNVTRTGTSPDDANGDSAVNSV